MYLDEDGNEVEGHVYINEDGIEVVDVYFDEFGNEIPYDMIDFSEENKNADDQNVDTNDQNHDT